MAIETRTPLWALRTLSRGIRLLGTEKGARAGSMLGDVLRLALRSKAILARENLKLAYPEASERWIREVERGMFHHLGRTGVEFLQFPDRGEDWFRQHVSVSGLDRAMGALALGRGAFVLSAHYGNWEVTFKRLSYDFPKRVYALIRRIKDPNVDLFIKNYREVYTGATCVLQDNAGSQLVRILRKNGIIITVLDQNADRKEGAFVPFFGRLAATYSSTARLALRMGVPVIPIFGHRTTATDHVVNILEPIMPDDSFQGDNSAALLEEAVESLTRRFSLTMEQAIREHPEQWIWLHNRWKTRPPEEQGCDR